MDELEKIVQQAIDSQRLRELEREEERKKMIAWRANPMTPEELSQAEELVKYAEIRMAERTKEKEEKKKKASQKN